MEFKKRTIGVTLLILSLLAIGVVVWYLLFGVSGDSSFEGGILVEGIESVSRMGCL